MENNVIALDVDGVLLDCDLGFRLVAEAILGRKMEPLNSEYDLKVRYQLTAEESAIVFEKMKTHELGWKGMPKLENAIEAALHLQEIGYNIQLVTAIPEELKELRLECLKNYGLIPDGIHCAGHHTASKKEILQKINPIMLVDDRLKHLYECDEVEYRVWVDLNHKQDDGLEFDGTQLFKVKSLHDWVEHWVEHYHIWNNKKSKNFKI